MSSQRGISGDNHDYWTTLSPHRVGQPAEELLVNGGSLSTAEWDALGDVASASVLQLACSTGDEAISLAARGARVTAVDFAEPHLVTARAKAASAGVDVEFVRADLNALTGELVGFDLVHLSWGAICWVDDLDAWMVDLAARLNPGGRVVISEHHPIWEVISVVWQDHVRVTADYFGSRTGYPDPSKAPQITQTLGDTGVQPTSRVWGLGALVSAAIRAHLSVASLQEWPEAEMYPELGETAHWLPATYLLVLSKN